MDRFSLSGLRRRDEVDFDYLEGMKTNIFLTYLSKESFLSIVTLLPPLQPSISIYLLKRSRDFSMIRISVTSPMWIILIKRYKSIYGFSLCSFVPERKR